MDLGPVLRDGYLYKRRENRSWRKVWAALRANYLSFAKGPKEKEKEWSHIPLKGAVLRKAGPFPGFPDPLSDPPRENCFELQQFPSGEHIFSAEKALDGTQWLLKLSDAVAAANPGLPAVQLDGPPPPPVTTGQARGMNSSQSIGWDDADSETAPSASATSNATSLKVSSTPSTTTLGASMSNQGSGSDSVKSPGGKPAGAAGKTGASDLRSMWDAIKLLQEPEQISKALKNYIETTGVDISAADASGWTMLLDAAAAQNLPLCMELLKMKADPTIDTGNSILHSLVQIPNQEEKFEKEAGKFLDQVLKITGPAFLDRLNANGESPLFRAIQFGNLAWTRLLLEREANPFLAFVPSTRPTGHAERYRKVYFVLDAAIGLYKEAQAQKLERMRRKGSRKESVAAIMQQSEPWRNRGLQSEQIRSAVRRDRQTDPDAAFVLEPFSPSTLAAVHQRFMNSAKLTESWAAMQNTCLKMDRLTLLKEAEGRYYKAFATNNEVLQSATESVTLINSHFAPLAWEIAKYYPTLESWDPSTLRFELQGPRKGILQPTETVTFTVSVLATKATKFFQLMAVSFNELTPGAPVGATYLLFDADMQPPAELRDFEIEATRLPPLKTVIGTGASATVYKVGNFLPQCLEPNIAVKAFAYNLQRGLAEHADDFRRFKLELFISSRLEHPNIVKTYGFVGTPPCLLMEYVTYSLRHLIDSSDVALTPANKMKLCLGICRGMAHLHSRGYLHRDMKPGNVLVTENFDAKIADFGIAISGGGRITSNDQFEGTLFYMSPETLKEKTFTKEGDVYATGIVIYELIKGVDAMTEQGCKDKSRLGFCEERQKAPGPIKSGDLAVVEPAGIRGYLERCFAAPAARPTFEESVDILNAIRKEFLKLDLDQQVADIQAGELSLADALKDWLARAHVDAVNGKKFRKEVQSSKVLAFIVDRLLTMTVAAADMHDLAFFIQEMYGIEHKDLPVNCYALQQAFAKLQAQPGGQRKVSELVAVMKSNIVRSLNAADLSAPPTSTEVNNWMDFLTFVDRDGQLKAELGPRRYESDRKELQEKIKKLERGLKEAKKRLAAIDTQPLATEYLTSFMRAADQTAEMTKLLTTCESDINRLDHQLEYKDYAVLFEAASQSREAERFRVLFTHFSEELRAVKGRVTALRVLLAKRPTESARAEALMNRIVLIQGRFPAHAWTTPEEKEKEKAPSKDEKSRDKGPDRAGSSREVIIGGHKIM